MSNESFASIEFVTLSDASLAGACGGKGIPWKKIGEYAAPLLLTNPVTAPIGAAALNKGAAVQGAIWGGFGAVGGGLTGGVPGAVIAGTTGAAAGYYGALASRDIPT
jgi:hypothetical protein